jgi:hypothetical protein
MRFVLEKSCLSLMLCFVLVRCSSQPPTTQQSKASGVLGEVKQESQPAYSGENPAGTSEKSLLIQLNEKLQSLGYEALGLQFESDETLLLLGKVFDSPVSHNKQVRIIYTGLEMSYDSKHQSLTIGGRKDLKSILSYIQKNIPNKKLSEPVKSFPSEIIAPASPKDVVPSKKTKGKKTAVKANKKPLRNTSKKTSSPSSTVTTMPSPASTTTSTATSEPQVTEPPVTEPQVTEPPVSEPQVTAPPNTTPPEIAPTPSDEVVSPEPAEPESNLPPEGPSDKVMKPTPL